MSIQLDWQIEADKSRHRKHPEDPNERRARYTGLIKLLLAIIVFLAIIGLIAYLIGRRLEQVDSRLEQLLRDTVDAEVAALRIGDEPTFIDIQRSATGDWIMAQQAVYSTYQTQKLASDIRLTGRIDNVKVDGQRARVQVEEIENGIPYLKTWFYWRYDDTVVEKTEVIGGVTTVKKETIPGGWRHVPPDYTFWGAPKTLDRTRFSVRYHEVDELLAQQMADRLEAWLSLACRAVPCETLPAITVDIVAVPLPEAAWAESGSAWQMVVPSPYVSRARADRPFDTALRIQTGTLFAERLVDAALNGRQPVFPADAHYLRSAVISWLVGRFVEIDTGAYLIDSLVKNHGEQRIGQLLQALQPSSDISLLSQITGAANLAEVNLDWRDFITWRLATEDDLILRRDEAQWLRLVDTRQEADRTSAYARYNATTPPEPKIATALSPQAAADGSPQVKVTLRIGANNVFREDYVVFTLVNNVWLRAG